MSGQCLRTRARARTTATCHTPQRRKTRMALRPVPVLVALSEWGRDRGGGSDSAPDSGGYLAVPGASGADIQTRERSITTCIKVTPRPGRVSVDANGKPMPQSSAVCVRTHAVDFDLTLA